MTETETLDLLWGIDQIAAFIGRTPRQTYEALAKHELPARQVNRRWVASKRKLREHFEGEAA
ncbi:DNA-binding protein [Pelagibacterium halotolerans]|uniref:DNA-binding protein n=1 Tax=Pelagibacterium halotolerans TaxID=531813 RepID=UPI0038513C53